MAFIPLYMCVHVHEIYSKCIAVSTGQPAHEVRNCTTDHTLADVDLPLCYDWLIPILFAIFLSALIAVLRYVRLLKLKIYSK